MTSSDTQDPRYALDAVLTGLDQRLTSQEQLLATVVGDLQAARTEVHQWEVRWVRLTELLTTLSEHLAAQTQRAEALAEHLIALQEQLDGPGYD